MDTHRIYFFEWCGWLGHAIYGLAFWESGGWLALFTQGLLLASIVWITGIPPTEDQALRSKGDAYRAYQQRVSRFVHGLPGEHQIRAPKHDPKHTLSPVRLPHLPSPLVSRRLHRV